MIQVRLFECCLRYMREHAACRTWHVARGTWHVARSIWHAARCTRHVVRSTRTWYLLQAIVVGGAEGEAFERKCAEEPEHAAAMARGLSRWYNWTGEPVPPQLDAWFARAAK